MEISAIVGEVVRIGEMRFASNGSPWIPLTVKTVQMNNGREFTQLHDMVVWGQLAQQVHETVAFGAIIEAVSDIRNRKDDKTGVYKTQHNPFRVSVIVQSATHQPGVPYSSKQSSESQPEATKPPADEDLPF